LIPRLKLLTRILRLPHRLLLRLLSALRQLRGDRVVLRNLIRNLILRGLSPTAVHHSFGRRVQCALLLRCGCLAGFQSRQPVLIVLRLLRHPLLHLLRGTQVGTAADTHLAECVVDRRRPCWTDTCWW
jgi:hypothetical protein